MYDYISFDNIYVMEYGYEHEGNAPKKRCEVVLGRKVYNALKLFNFL